MPRCLTESPRCVGFSSHPTFLLRNEQDQWCNLIPANLVFLEAGRNRCDDCFQLRTPALDLDHLGRPIDLAVSGGKLYVLEYCRQTETVGPGSAGYGVGGRVIEVTADP